MSRKEGIPVGMGTDCGSGHPGVGLPDKTLPPTRRHPLGRHPQADIPWAGVKLLPTSSELHQKIGVNIVALVNRF